jgi:hypothetical protein
VTTRDYIALAEFSLTASGFEFVGRKGDHAVKLRRELGNAILQLQSYLSRSLHAGENAEGVLAHPITNRLHAQGWLGNAALWAVVPTAPDEWVEIFQATADQATAALDFLRATRAEWQERLPVALDVAERLQNPANLPGASEYAEAVHIAEMLAFVGAKLMALYAGIMHSMPVYRLYPAMAEREAIGLWWPWGHPPPLVDGGPAKPRLRKKVVDPGIITATRPQDVVREVMERTGINRTTVQRMTARLRAGMRAERKTQALRMLQAGATRAAVARAVELSPSRISAMFKGQDFSTKEGGKEPSDPLDCAA